MQALSPGDIITAWEHGRTMHTVDRALLLLTLSYHGRSTAELADLTVGERNTLLLSVRQKTLGSLAQCFTRCSRCEAPLEFTMDTTALFTALPESVPVTHIHMLTMDDLCIRFRLPTSADLAAVVGRDSSTGRHLLVERCIVTALRNDEPLPTTSLPETLIVALAGAMLEHDPQAEIALSLGCSECDHSWMTIFDVVSFFWIELEAYARRLLRDVDTLARAYGWREADTLALSTTRRQFYLDLVCG